MSRQTSSVFLMFVLMARINLTFPRQWLQPPQGRRQLVHAAAGEIRTAIAELKQRLHQVPALQD